MLGTVIIGAGFAGLSAAASLRARGDDSFVVLEARDRPGGRTKAGKLGGLTVDLGGMWVAPSQARLQKLATSYGIETYPTHLDGNAIFRIGGKKAQGPREELGHLLGLFGGFAYLRSRRQLDRLMGPLDCARPWDHPAAKHLDAMTVEDWIGGNVRHSLLASAYRTVCRSLLCGEASQISMLFFLYYLKSGGGLEVLISSDTGGAQNTLFYGGTHQLAQRMADELGDRLWLNTAVDSIRWSNDRVVVGSAERTFVARKVIIAAPPPLISGIAFSPRLPPFKTALHERSVMGSAIKFWVLYETPFWRDQGLNGMIFQDDSPATPIMDVTPPNQTNGVLVGFFDSDAALRHADLSHEARRDVVLEALAEHFGPLARHPLAYLDHDWTSARWSKGCYGAFTPPGVLTGYGEWLRRPIGPLHWAGTETSSIWTGYIEGAIRSGERAAAEVSTATQPAAEPCALSAVTHQRLCQPGLDGQQVVGRGTHRRGGRGCVGTEPADHDEIGFVST